MKLLACIRKEALVLSRDKAGLAIIFIMPLALVFICTLVQEESFRAMREVKRDVLLVNQDTGVYGETFERRLTDSGAFNVVKELDGAPLTEETAQAAVAQGRYQVCIVIPEGLTEASMQGADDLLADFFARIGESEDEEGFGPSNKSDDEPPDPLEPSEPVTGLSVCFDPAAGGLFKSAISGALEQVAQGIEMEVIVTSFVSAFSDEMRESLEKELEELWDEGMVPEVDPDELGWAPGGLIAVNESHASEEALNNIASSVQQNVPAWALFAMFFIVVPLAGSMIKERDGGTLVRLRTLPVSAVWILLGKVAVYVVVCLGLFGMMLIIGTTFLPMCGTPALELGPHPAALWMVALACALAATGFGMMVGTLARTQEQASTFGATAVVIAAALAGVMVPTFLMPKAMQQVSAFSPLNWGLTSFLDIFVRDAGIADVGIRVGGLAVFFVAAMTVAVAGYMRRE
ncbi:MAG: ABC-2 transporter permease [bacterium]|nr:ABC-2 transporter permease [bacterium]